MALKNKNINPAELKGAERVFQIDRDTILIYTGQHPQDLRPFSRIGAGFQLPVHLLPLIEHVIVPENHLWNTGVEDAWLRAGVDSGSELTYVGSKERVNQLNRYFEIESYLKEKQKAEREQQKDKAATAKTKEAAKPLPVTYEVYQAPERGGDSRNKCLITYLATGDYQVTVGNSKVLDSGSYFRSRIGIDREYAMMSKVLAKSNQPLSSGFSFMPFEYQDYSSLLWNFQGSLLFADPVPEYHYPLFAKGIDADRIEMALAGSVYQPGLVELLRRADVTKRVVGISAPDSEKLGLLKRTFNFAQPKLFSEGGALPLARSVSFFESRTRSHGAFVFRTRDDAEHPVQVLFPFMKTKPSRSFDFVKGPFDLEFAIINDKVDLTDGMSGLARIVRQGTMPRKNYENLKLDTNVYPIIMGAEYSFMQVIQNSDWIDRAGAALSGSEFEAPVTEILKLLRSGEAAELAAIQDSLYIIRTQPIPKDKLLLFNLSAILNVVYRIMSRFTTEDRSVIDLAAKVASRFSASKLRIRDIEDLATDSQSLAFDIITMVGDYTLLLGYFKVPPFQIQIQYPPSADLVVETERDYRKFLKAQQKIVDKVGSVEDRGAVELLEKLFEEALGHGKERSRLRALVDALDIKGVAITEEAGLPFYMKLPYWLRVVVQWLRIPQLVDWCKDIKGRTFAALAGWFANRAASTSSTSSSMGGKAALIVAGIGVALAIMIFGFSRVDFSNLSHLFSSKTVNQQNTVVSQTTNTEHTDTNNVSTEKKNQSI